MSSQIKNNKSYLNPYVMSEISLLTNMSNNILTQDKLPELIFQTGRFDDTSSSLLGQELMKLNNSLQVQNHDFHDEVVELLDKFKDASAYEFIIGMV